MQPGTIVDDRYEIIDEIGDGGMGTVYKARELGLYRDVALKLLHFTLVDENENMWRFEREAKILSELKHPHITIFYRFGLWQRVPFIAMEFVKGRSLRQILNDDARLPTADVIELGLQVSDALEAARQAGIVHRDIKPNNIMVVDDVSEGIFAKILDFGLARIQPVESSTAQQLTRTGELIGTVSYMSPEQCRGQPADHRSDIYSLGCVLYECLQGSAPFAAENPIALMHQHVNEPPPPLPKSLPPGLESVVMKAMAKTVDLRYQTISQMREDLTLVADGRGAEITPVQKDRSIKPRESQTRLATIAGALLLLAIPLLVCQKFASDKKYVETSVQTTSHADLGPLVDSNTFCRNYPTTAERTIALKRWLSKYAKRNTLAVAHIYAQLHFDLSECGALYEERLETAEAAIRILDHAVTNFQPVEEMPTYILEALLVESELYRSILKPTKGIDLLKSTLDKWDKHLSPGDRWRLHEAIYSMASETGDDRTAEEYLRRSISTLGYNTRITRATYAKLLARNGRMTEARAVLEKALAICPARGGARAEVDNALASALLDVGMLREAAEYADRALAESDDEGDKLDSYGMKAQCLFLLHQYSEANRYAHLWWNGSRSRPSKSWEALKFIIINAYHGKLAEDENALFAQQLSRCRNDKKALLVGLCDLVYNLSVSSGMKKAHKYATCAASAFEKLSDEQFILFNDLAFDFAYQLYQYGEHELALQLATNLMEKTERISNRPDLGADDKKHLRARALIELARAKQNLDVKAGLKMLSEVCDGVGRNSWSLDRIRGIDLRIDLLSKVDRLAARKDLMNFLKSFENVMPVAQKSSLLRRYAHLCDDAKERELYLRQSDEVLSKQKL